MSRFSKNRSFRFESLEERRVMAADAMAAVLAPSALDAVPAAETVHAAPARRGEWNVQPGADSQGAGSNAAAFDLSAKSYADASTSMIWQPPIVWLDASLSAYWQQVGKTNMVELVVDGSDFDDVIKVLSSQTNGSRTTLTLQLEKWSNGVRSSSQTLSFQTPVGTILAPFALQIYGRGGNDRIENWTGSSMAASGGAGNDTIIGGSNADLLNGDAGFDVIYGGAGRDTINGGTENDRIYGQGDVDIIHGNEGNDVIYGGVGGDYLYGDNGHDMIHGDDGVWDYYANYADFIYGGEGNDWLDGEAGNDHLFGDGGSDTLLGSFGNDQMYGGLGNDKLYGEHGNDRMFGQEGVDELYGGYDHDYLDGGYKSSNGGINEPDYLEGNGGNDTFVRHVSVFGVDDPDFFGDKSKSDSVDNVYHW